MPDSPTSSGFSLVWASGAAHRPGELFLSPAERTFRYGDGIFATLRLEGGLLLDGAAHLARIALGARAVELAVPKAVRTAEGLRAVLRELGVDSSTSAIVRIQISAAPSSRGFARTEDETSWELVELFPQPRSRRPSIVVLADGEIPVPALPSIKSCSALSHVLCGRAAARRGADEAVRVHDGVLTEASASNLFWLDRGALRTPSEDLPLYPGVTREVALRVAADIGLTTEEGGYGAEALTQAEGAFLTNAVRGIEPVARIDGRGLDWPEPLEILRNAVDQARLEAAIPV